MKRRPHGTESGAARAGSAALACALLAMITAAPAGAQDMSVLLQSVENIEKRVNRLDAEMVGIRKTGSPRPAGADSLSPRLERLAGRVADLEKARGGQETEGGAARDGELVSLAREVKGLADAVRSGLAASAAKAAPPSPAASAQPPSAPAPPPPKPPEAASPPPAPDLALSGNVQIHGEKRLTSASGRDNLDLFWGRVNIGLDFKDERLQSKVNVRIFPEGFGFEPLTSVAFDTAGQGGVKAQAEPQAKVQLTQAWARYSRAAASLRVGRMEMHDGPSESYGYYLDLGPGGKFLSRKPGSAHNALEVEGRRGASATSLALATGDRKLNRGYLRVRQKFALPPRWQAELGYRSNLFDRWKFPDAEILHRYSALLAFAPRPGFLLFAEGGLLQVMNREEDDIPILAGAQFPAGPWADLVSLEAEYLSTRKVATGTASEDKALLFNAHVRKKLWKRLNIDLGLFSDAARPDPAALGFGLRMTSAIK